MRKPLKKVLFIVSILIGPGWAHAEQPPAPIVWHAWSDDIFAQAQKENRFVLLDLEAVWCHWCHVMDETTYQDPAVRQLIQAHYLAVRVDQDSRPDLSNRYEDYGWPATIVFDAHGHEIVKRAGYIPPPRMAVLLDAIIKDPSPGPSVRPEEVLTFPGQALISPALEGRLQKSYVELYDSEHGGWGKQQKFLQADCLEYAIARAREGSTEDAARAQKTLSAIQAIIDPVWGGIDQYSVNGDWKEPHFEKIMSFQTDALQIYALAYAQWRQPDDLKMARGLERYLQNFLTSPEGLFYTSQDADLHPGEHSADYYKLGDADRRRLGIPRIDTHIYSRENGWAIRALTLLYEATGDDAVLKKAVRATHGILDTRSITGGGFRHDTVDASGPYLADTLSMGQAFLELYIATADRAWLRHAEDSADFIQAHFSNVTKEGSIGFISAQTAQLAAYKPAPQRGENIALVRFANLLGHITGRAQDHAMAEQALRYVAAPEVAERLQTAGVLLAWQEFKSDPVHVSIIGAKDDPQAKALFSAALAYPSYYKQVEWLDAREGPLPHSEVTYPTLSKAAAFSCANQRCSLPIFKPEDIRPRLEHLRHS